MTKKVLLDAVKGQQHKRLPIWIMRQAGRYLPEYKAIREKAGGFLDLCFTPELATEVTLQPLRRFDLDAAILFSDILVIPHALGRKVWFVAGEGPRLEPISAGDISHLTLGDVVKNLAPVMQSVAFIKSQLADEKTLIGFCGSPWTVATYMIAGQGSSDQAQARLFALEHPEAFEQLLHVLVEASIAYLAAQFQAGADVVQLFESWAANLDEQSYRRHVIGPNRRIVEGVRKIIPDAPIIGFPRGAPAMLDAYVRETGVNMVGLDYAVPLESVNALLPEGFGVQGNLDPLRVVAGGQQMLDRAREIIAAFKDRPHIFNLGHGIVPQTPIAHVEELIAGVRALEK